MSDLAEFLLARIAEDERFARNALSRGWVAQRDVDMLRVDYHIPIVSAAHIARWDPARVLAECDAKRRIVEAYAEYLSTVRAYRSPRWSDAMNEQDKQDARQAEARHRVAEDVARLLALPYADHPDFREEWRP